MNRSQCKDRFGISVVTLAPRLVGQSWFQSQAPEGGHPEGCHVTYPVPTREPDLFAFPSARVRDTTIIEAGF